MTDYIFNWTSTLTHTGNFVVGSRYVIQTPGNTDFTSFGAVSNNIGTTFIVNNNTVTSTNLIAGKAYKILTLGTTNFAAVGAVLFSGGGFVSGNTYIIASVGTTNFTLLGAASNTVGTIFTASFAGTDPTSGTTGTAYGQVFVATGNGSGTGTVSGNTGTGVASTALKPSFTVAGSNVDISSTPLILSGRGALNWGRSVQEDLLYVMENFANSTPPTNPTIGQTWYNSQTGDLNYYSQPLVIAGSFVIGQSYLISTVGSTDFTAVGAVSSLPGVTFIATGAGAGSGSAIALDTPGWKGVKATELGSITVASVAGNSANIFNVGGAWIDYTGTNRATGFITGTRKSTVTCRAASACGFALSASLVCDGLSSGNIDVAAGTVFQVIQEATLQRLVIPSYSGSFTAAFAFSAPGSSSFTYTSQAGYFVKNGKQLLVEGHLTTSATTVGTGSGSLQITGFPFPVSSTAIFGGIEIEYSSGFATLFPTSAIIPSASTSATLYARSSTTASQILQVPNVGNVMDVYFTGTYPV